MYYTKDHKLVKEVPKHRLKHREIGIDNPDREVLIQPNNIEFFYAEEETSERTYRIESFLERLYRTLLWAGLCFGSIAIFLHVRQHRAMHLYANEVSKKIEKEGGRAVVGEDDSVTIYMDGKVQEIIPKDDRRIVNNQVDSIKRNDIVRQHLRELIAILYQSGKGRREYQYYADIIKPEL